MLIFRPLPLAVTAAATPTGIDCCQPWWTRPVARFVSAAVIATTYPVLAPQVITAPAATPSLGWFEPFDTAAPRRSAVPPLDGFAWEGREIPAATPSGFGWQQPFGTARQGFNKAALLDSVTWEAQIVPAATPSGFGWQQNFVGTRAKPNPVSAYDGIAWEAQIVPAATPSGLGWLQPFSAAKTKAASAILLNGTAWAPQAVAATSAQPAIGWHTPFDVSQRQRLTKPLDGFTSAYPPAPQSFGWFVGFDVPKPAKPSPQGGTVSPVAPGGAPTPAELGWFTAFQARWQVPSPKLFDGFSLGYAQEVPADVPVFGWFGVWPVTRAAQIDIRLHAGPAFVPPDEGGVTPPVIDEPPVTRGRGYSRWYTYPVRWTTLKGRARALRWPVKIVERKSSAPIPAQLFLSWQRVDGRAEILFRSEIDKRLAIEARNARIWAAMQADRQHAIDLLLSLPLEM
jgi:hypothetical protein